MNRSQVLLGVVCAVTMGCAQQLSRQEIAVEAQVVRDRVNAWSRAFSNRVAGELADFYHQAPELSVSWADGNRSRGWEEQEQAARAFFQTTARMNVALQDLEVEVLAPNVAVATFRHSTDIIFTTTARDIYSGQGTQVWVKDPVDDAWKIHAEHVSRGDAGDM